VAGAQLLVELVAVGVLGELGRQADLGQRLAITSAESLLPPGWIWVPIAS
jgi:hypothetical protein